MLTLIFTINKKTRIMKRQFLVLVENIKIKRAARTEFTVYEGNNELVKFDVPQFSNRGAMSEVISKLVEKEILDESFMENGYANTKVYDDLFIRMVYGTNLQMSTSGTPIAPYFLTK